MYLPGNIKIQFFKWFGKHKSILYDLLNWFPNEKFRNSVIIKSIINFELVI